MLAITISLATNHIFSPFSPPNSPRLPLANCITPGQMYSMAYCTSYDPQMIFTVFKLKRGGGGEICKLNLLMKASYVTDKTKTVYLQFAPI